MDYKKILDKALGSAHVQFHHFSLACSKGTPDEQYFFFEGYDDPCFYIDKAQRHIGDRPHHEFVCNGRDGVLKAHDLVARDSRAIDRSHFFIDKDLNDIINGRSAFSRSVYQTSTYSFENFIVCEKVLRRFWVERINLPSTDERLHDAISSFHEMHKKIMKKMRVLMAIVLIGRGVGGHPEAKLNLNNVNLISILRIDFTKKTVGWRPNSMRTFLASLNMIEPGRDAIRWTEIKSFCHKHLSDSNAKNYVRGKFELWFFVKFLMAITQELTDKKMARTDGVARAKPKDSITHNNCFIHLSPLCPCPLELSQFLESRLRAG